jgi:hypothetical protein
MKGALAFVLVAAMLAASVFTGVAAAQTTDTEVATFPFTAAIPACNGEPVVVVGTMHVQSHITAQDGRLLVETSTWSKDAQGKGQLTGAQYVYNNETGDLLLARYEQDYYVSRQRTTINLVRLGEDGNPVAGEDLFVLVIVHTEVQLSTGEQTVREVQAKGECR